MGSRTSVDEDGASALDAWLAALVAHHASSILSFTEPIAEDWGRMCSPDPLPVVDGLLAATAKLHGLTFVTRNTTLKPRAYPFSIPSSRPPNHGQSTSRSDSNSLTRERAAVRPPTLDCGKLTGDCIRRAGVSENGSPAQWARGDRGWPRTRAESLTAKKWRLGRVSTENHVCLL